MAKWLNAVLGGPCTFTVTHNGDPVTDVASVLSTTGGVITLTTDSQTGDTWSVTVTPDYLPAPSKFRMRAFDLSGPVTSASAIASTLGVVGQTVSLTVGPPVLPDPVDFTSFGRTARLEIEEGATEGDTYSWVLEYDAETADVFPIRGTLRTYRCSTNPMTVFVRTEEGPLDLSAVTTLEAIIVEGDWGWWWGGWDYQYSPPWGWEVRIPAYSPEPGRVQWTIDRTHTRTRLWGPSHTLFVRADDRTIYSALLEVVG